MIVAIDPGTSGCIAVLSPAGSLVDFCHMPTAKIGKRNRVNAAAIWGFLAPYADQVQHAYIEKVQSMPGQGVASMFSFGHAAGLVEGVVAGMQVPMTLVTPQSWKKHHGLIGKDKDASRTRCIQLFPDCRELDLKAKGQALADAVLIGLYGIAHG